MSSALFLVFISVLMTLLGVMFGPGFCAMSIRLVSLLGRLLFDGSQLCADFVHASEHFTSKFYERRRLKDL